MTDEERKQFINEYCRNVGNIKIKCDDCKFVEDCVDYGWEGCKKFTQKQPHTNEEWLCGLSTEEKADKLTDFSFWLVPTIPSEDKREQIRKKIELWLKEKHNEMPELWWNV